MILYLNLNLHLSLISAYHCLFDSSWNLPRTPCLKDLSIHSLSHLPHCPCFRPTQNHILTKNCVRSSWPLSTYAVSYTHLDVYKRQDITILLCFVIIILLSYLSEIYQNVNKNTKQLYIYDIVLVLFFLEACVRRRDIVCKKKM